MLKKLRVQSFLQAVAVTEMFASGGTGICTSWIVLHTHEGNASIDGTHFKQKGLHISAYMEIANFSASNGWIHTFKRRHTTDFLNLPGKNRKIDPETAEDWKNYQLLQ